MGIVANLKKFSQGIPEIQEWFGRMDGQLIMLVFHVVCCCPDVLKTFGYNLVMPKNGFGTLV